MLGMLDMHLQNLLRADPATTYKHGTIRPLLRQDAREELLATSDE